MDKVSYFVNVSVPCNGSCETSSESLVWSTACRPRQREERPQHSLLCHTGKHVFVNGHLDYGL